MSEGLKPCPFCGGEAEGKIGQATGWVQCTTVGCDGHQMHYTLDAAIAAWNTRPTEAAAEARGMAEIERLRALLEDALYYVHHHEQEYDTKGRMTLATNIRAALNGGQHE